LEINKTVIVASSWSSIFTLPTLMMHGQTQIKKDNVAFSAGGSVTASLVGSLTEFLIRVATDVKFQALP
jgi:hypothetical protein